MMLKKLIKRIMLPHTYSSDAYISYLRKNKIIIGNNVSIYSPNSVFIDIRKPYLISIGDNCKITNGVFILAHDYSVSVPRRIYGSFIGGSAPVRIGNNCFIGVNSTILMGTTIGNNCIIGANSVVKGSFSDNVVIAGNPAKVICTVEEYYNKNKSEWLNNAKLVAKEIYRNSGRYPTIEEMSDGFCWLYLPRDEKSVKKYKVFFDLSSDDYDDIVKCFMNEKPLYNSFEDFLNDCELDKVN